MNLSDVLILSAVLILVACGVLAIAILQIVKVRLAKRQS